MKAFLNLIVHVLLAFSTKACIEVKDCICFDNNVALFYSCDSSNFSNVVQSIPQNATHLTYYAKNKEVNLHDNNLWRLKQLKSLKISSNQNSGLFQWIKEIPGNKVNIFPGDNLKKLHINIPWELKEPVPHLFDGLIHLEELDLSNTRIMNISNLIVGLSGLVSNSKLTTLNLWNMQTFELAHHGLSMDLASLLSNLRNAPLRYINLGYNALREIKPPGLIHFAPYLEEIDLSNNMIIPLVTSALFLEIIMHPNIKKADLGEQIFGHGRLKRQSGIGGSSRCELFSPANKDNLNALSSDKQLFCNYLKKQNYDLFAGIPCQYIPELKGFLRKSCNGCYVVPISGSITHLNLTSQNVYDEVAIFEEYSVGKNCIYSGTSLKVVDFSNNIDFGWIGIKDIVEVQLDGFRDLEEIYLSKCGLKKFYPQFWEGLPGLRIIDISNNYITYINASLLRQNSDLRVFDASHNYIKTLDFHSFTNSFQLQVISLSNNRISGAFELNVSKLVNLKTLNLRSNFIEYFSETMLDQLEAVSINTSLTVDLPLNLLTCGCHTQDFIKWILNVPEKITLSNSASYECRTSEAQSVLVNAKTNKELSDSCRIRDVYISASIIGTLAFVLIIVAIFIIYKRRWRIRYRLYLARNMWRNRVHAMNYASYDFDAYVCYNADDRFWVHEFLRPILEDEKGLKLCLHFRDFLPGEIIEDQVLASIDKSHKTVLILSPNFLKSRWCFFELQMARNRLFMHGIDVLVLVILSPLPLTDVPKTLANLMENKVYLEWTTDPDGQKLFWRKLEQAIRTPRKDNFPLSTNKHEETNEENPETTEAGGSITTVMM